MEKNNKLHLVTKGLIKENPVLRLVLGTCPTLAVTTLAVNGIGMGLAATFVLICSNAAISALRKIIPDKVRIPAYITVIAGFVSIVQMFVKAYAQELDAALGVYLPLIVQKLSLQKIMLSTPHLTVSVWVSALHSHLQSWVQFVNSWAQAHFSEFRF